MVVRGKDVQIALRLKYNASIYHEAGAHQPPPPSEYVFCI